MKKINRKVEEGEKGMGGNRGVRAKTFSTF
jgi:hypothetical protein